MDTILAELISILSGGGPQAILAILMLAIVLLLVERRGLEKEVAKRWDKKLAIAEQYYQGNITCSEACNSLRGVLITMGQKL